MIWQDLKSILLHYVCQVGVVVLGASLKKTLTPAPQDAPDHYHYLDIELLILHPHLSYRD